MGSLSMARSRLEYGYMPIYLWLYSYTKINKYFYLVAYTAYTGMLSD